ncbi:MAG: benzoate/H(+) symporter BenE family transporter [Allobranchiibius sp.]
MSTQPPADLSARLRLSDFSTSTVVAGLIAIVVGFSGPVAIIFTAASAGHLTAGQTSSWLLAASVGSGVVGIALTLWTRMPVVIAWSTPGAALLVTSIGAHPFSDMVGAYVICAVAMIAIAISGAFDAVMARIPMPVVMGMLAGILLEFVVGAFGAVRSAPAVALSVIVVYFVVQRLSARWAVPAALLAGLVVSLSTGSVRGAGVAVSFARAELTLPTFSPGAFFGVALPLFVVTLTAQNAAGLGVLRSFGYPARARNLVTATGVGSLVGAFFGSHAINLAAITAALCAGPSAHPDPRRRWTAALTTGVAYLVVGILGGTLVALFAGLAVALIAAVAGVALLPTFSSSLTSAVHDADHRPAALVCFAVTASGISVVGVGAACWGLLAGLLVTGIDSGMGEIRRRR